MSAWTPAEVLAVGMVTPVGLTAPSSAAAIRAGIQRLELSNLLNARGQPLRTGLLREEHLPPLAEGLARSVGEVSGRYQRMLRLSVGALREAAAGLSRPPPLMLALPERREETEELLGSAFMKLLASQSGISLDLRSSQSFPLGRAGGLIAVERALRMLATGQVPGVLVGGVDTYFDVSLLTALDAEGRLQNSAGPSDGFIPGEGAAFMLLAPLGEGRRQGRVPLARVTSAGVGVEEGHRYSEKPYRGEGLAQAFHELFQRWPASADPVQCVYAGLNGESFWTKEWGVSYLRHARFFDASLRVEHPIECIGDPGAALGVLMTALAALGIQRGYRASPCLVWCSSDHQERAAAMIESMPVRGGGYGNDGLRQWTGNRC